MDIISSIISQIKNPFQYILIGICWFIFEFYKFPSAFLIPSIMISSGIAYGLSHQFYWLFKCIISWWKKRSFQTQQDKRIEKEIVTFLSYLSCNNDQLDRLNRLMNMEHLGYINHKKIDNSKAELVDCVFFIREVNMNTYQQNGVQWFREDYDQIMKCHYIWINPRLMDIYQKLAKKSKRTKK